MTQRHDKNLLTSHLKSLTNIFKKKKAQGVSKEHDFSSADANNMGSL